MVVRNNNFTASLSGNVGTEVCGVLGSSGTVGSAVGVAGMSRASSVPPAAMVLAVKSPVTCSTHTTDSTDVRASRDLKNVVEIDEENTTAQLAEILSHGPTTSPS
jgi:hypothetical protein